MLKLFGIKNKKEKFNEQEIKNLKEKNKLLCRYALDLYASKK